MMCCEVVFLLFCGVVLMDADFSHEEAPYEEDGVELCRKIVTFCAMTATLFSQFSIHVVSRAF